MNNQARPWHPSKTSNQEGMRTVLVKLQPVNKPKVQKNQPPHEQNVLEAVKQPFAQNCTFTTHATSSAVAQVVQRCTTLTEMRSQWLHRIHMDYLTLMLMTWWAWTSSFYALTNTLFCCSILLHKAVTVNCKSLPPHPLGLAGLNLKSWRTHF